MLHALSWRNWAFIVAAGFIAFLLYDKYGPYPPVVTDMQAVAGWQTHHTTILHVVGNKEEKCVRIEDSETGYFTTIENPDAWKKVGFYFAGHVQGSSSRPTGLNDFGNWVWNTGNASKVLITVQHTCTKNNEQSIVETTIGPFDVHSLERTQE